MDGRCMVGSLGATQLAAVGFGGIWLWTCVCFLMGSASAVQTFVSQHYGAGEMRACGPWTIVRSADRSAQW